MPASDSSRAVPPVETISTPSSLSPRAKSTSPRLSETVSRARRTRTAPGSATCGTWPSATPTGRPLVGPRGLLLVDHAARVRRIDPGPPGGDQPHRPRQQAVLDLVDASLHGGDVTRIRDRVERFLEDDRPAVDALVDEVHRDPHDPHPVVERLLDRVEP